MGRKRTGCSVVKSVISRSPETDSCLQQIEPVQNLIKLIMLWSQSRSEKRKSLLTALIDILTMLMTTRCLQSTHDDTLHLHFRDTLLHPDYGFTCFIIRTGVKSRYIILRFEIKEVLQSVKDQTFKDGSVENRWRCGSHHHKNHEYRV